VNARSFTFQHRWKADEVERHDDPNENAEMGKEKREREYLIILPRRHFDGDRKRLNSGETGWPGEDRGMREKREWNLKEG
jgi:hypothetical protein